MKKLLIAVLPLAAITTVVMAEPAAPYAADPGPRAGNREATLTGSGLSDSDFNDSNFGVTGSYGYYYDDNVIVTLKQSLQLNDTGTSTLVDGRTILQAAYQWDFGKWRPYAGMNVGGIYGAGVRDEALFGPEVGVKYYVNESTFLFGNVAYEVPVDECCDNGVVPYALGVGFNF